MAKLLKRLAVVVIACGLIGGQAAADVLFDFENAPLHASLPLDLTVGGVTAHFSATGQGYSIQDTQQVIGVLPAGFAGQGIVPNSINLSDLLVSLSQSLTSFSILVAPQDLNTDTSATLSVTAYFNSTLIGTASAVPPASGIWPSATLMFASTQPFNNVVVHYALPPPTGGDYGTIFVADNMIVTPAVPCGAFNDVLATDSFCTAVQWLANRSITTGCALGQYCPGSNVTRAQMALFMNRLGKALSLEILSQSATPGAVPVQSVAPFGVYCVTVDSTSTTGTLAAPQNHPTTAVIDSTFSGLADGTIAWKSWVVYSTDAGTTWTQVPATNAQRASASAGQWSSIPNDVAMALTPGLAYRFGIVIGRDDVVTGTLGNFSDSRCQIDAAIYNQNGTTPPY